MLDQILVHRNRTRPPIDTPQRTDFDTDVALLIREVNQINSAIDELGASIGRVPSAHAEIRKMLDDQPKGLETLELLVKDVKRIERFYRSVH